MRKTRDPIDAERKKKMKERRKYLIENLEVYQWDFDEAFKWYLTRKYPTGLDAEDCDNRFDPHFREEFTWSPEGRELAIKYSLERAWDPSPRNSAALPRLIPLQELAEQHFPLVS